MRKYGYFIILLIIMIFCILSQPNEAKATEYMQEAEYSNGSRYYTDSFSCSICANGRMLGFIKDGAYFEYTYAGVPQEDTYNLKLYYTSAVESKVELLINEKDTYFIPVPNAGGYNNLRTLDIRVTLKKGLNIIRITNISGRPYIDKIGLSNSLGRDPILSWYNSSEYASAPTKEAILKFFEKNNGKSFYFVKITDKDPSGSLAKKSFFFAVPPQVGCTLVKPISSRRINCPGANYIETLDSWGDRPATNKDIIFYGYEPQSAVMIALDQIASITGINSVSLIKQIAPFVPNEQSLVLDPIDTSTGAQIIKALRSTGWVKTKMLVS
jgi:hypothetical protein